MSTPLILVLVGTFAFAVGRSLTRLLAPYVTLSGVEYLCVGLLVGPLMPWTVLTHETLTQLRPFVHLLIGLVGFLVGLGARSAFQKPGHAVVGFGSTFLVALGTSILILVLLVWLDPHHGGESLFTVKRVLARFQNFRLELYIPGKLLWAALVIGAAAASCSSYAISNARRSLGSTGPVGDLLESSSHAAQLGSGLLLGVALASVRASEVTTKLNLSLVEWELAAILLGVVCGLLFGLFLGRENDQSRIFLATVGLVTFSAGIGSAVEISPLFVNMIAGITVSFSSPHAGTLRGHLNKLQHPLFVLLMVLVGALWVPTEPLLWVLVPMFIFARLAIRRVAMNSLAGTFLETPPATRLLGSGCWAPGTFAVAIAVSGSLRFPELSPLILSVVLAGTLLSELFSHRALRRLLDDAGEVHVDTSLNPPERELSLSATSPKENATS